MSPGFFRSLFQRSDDDRAGTGDDPPEPVRNDAHAVRLAEVIRREEKLRRDQEEVLDRERETARLAGRLDLREQELTDQAAALRSARREQEAALERTAGLGPEEARKILLARVEEENSREISLRVRRAEDEARLEADRRARGILAVAMQRLAAARTIEGNTTTVRLPGEEMKGRIIGKDGRNIRTLEGLTGVDIVIDETPETVVLSSFDPVRREIARLTLEQLIADGRIHPASCEAAFTEAESRIGEVMIDAANGALLEAKVTGVHPELVRLLGRLRFRTSYSQNVLAHLVECANLAAMMAAELGASVELARRGAMLHDIGKAVSHEVEGSHAEIGARVARRFDEGESVVHSIAAHHGEVEATTVEAVIVQAADAISAARPGARTDSLEQYVSRLSDLEQIASRPDGVRKVYAMKAGREIRVIVDPGEVTDSDLPVISRQVAAAIEREMNFPGQIRITVIRELRSSFTAH